METQSYFIVVKNTDDLKGLKLGQDIFKRPMPWFIWLKAIYPHQDNPWRFARVFDLPQAVETYQSITIEEGEVIFEDAHHFKLERPTPLLIIEWAIEAIYYRTALEFWRWPICLDIWQWLVRRYHVIKRYFTEF